MSDYTIIAVVISALARAAIDVCRKGAKVIDMSLQRERLHRLVDSLPEERVDEVADALELVAAEVMVDLQELLQDRERRIEEAYARGYGSSPQEPWIGRAGLEAGAALLKNEPQE